MIRFGHLILICFILAGCKKDEPARPVEVAVEKLAPKTEEPTVPIAEPKLDEPKQKLQVLDLRSAGLFATMEVPARSSATLTENGIVVLIPDSSPLTIVLGKLDLLEFSATWKKMLESKSLRLVRDEPETLFLEFDHNGEKSAIFAKNLLVGDVSIHVVMDEVGTTLEEAKRLSKCTQSLKQSPALAEAKKKHDASLVDLQKLGGNYGSMDDGSRFLSFQEGSTIDATGLDSMADLPEVSIVGLHDCTRLQAADLRKLEAMPWLRELSLRGGWVNGPVLKIVGDLRGLKALHITATPINDIVLRSLTGLTDLEELDLTETRITDNGIKTLLPLKNLHSLKLNGTDISDKGIVLLKGFLELSELSLSDTAIGDEALKDLALPKLAKLYVAETAITDAGIDSLAKLPGLTVIDLFGTSTTAKGVGKLKAANTKLVFLISWPLEETVEIAPLPPISLDKLPPADAAAMVAKLGGKIVRDEAAEGKPLIGIDLSNSKAGDADLAQLRTSTTLRNLNLENCPQVTDAGLPYLAGLNLLEELNLRGTKINGTGFVHLTKLAHLTKLYLAPETSLSGPQLKHLAKLPNLEILSFNVTEPAHPKLQILARMTKLKEVDLGGVELSNHKMAYLQEMKGLESLVIGRQGILSDRGLLPLKNLTELKTLVIHNYRGTDNGLGHLKSLANLKTLELWGPFITDRGMYHIGNLANLERIRLDRLSITDAGLLALRNLGKPIEIGLAQTGVTDRGLESLATLKDLEFADLSFTKITDAGLVKLKGMEELRGLRLEGTSVDGSGFKALADLPRLNQLLLRETKLNDAGLAAIALLPNLRTLDLGKTAITNNGIGHLKTLRNLVELNLADCDRLTDDIVPILKEFRALKKVVARGSKLSPKALDELRKLFAEIE